MAIFTRNDTRYGRLAALALMALPLAWGSATAEEPACATAEMSDDAHIEAIADAPLDTLMPLYAEDAYLEWVGGPLDGTYDGADAISEAWSRFIAGRGDISADIQSYAVSENPKGRTTIAAILYQGDKTIPVRLITTYREGLITAEIWQIDPAILD